jgi:hypothetical protein
MTGRIVRRSSGSRACADTLSVAVSVPPMKISTSLLFALTAVIAVGCSQEAEQDASTRDTAGNVVEGGDVGAFKLQLGDCIESDAGTEVESLPVVPCDQPHLYEVYHLFDIPDGDFPGAETVNTLSEEGCLAAFATFVGIPFEQSQYTFTSLTPTELTWTQADDREVVCMITTTDSTTVTGTLQGANA